MRILVALAVVVVFAALLVFDTESLLRLTVICVTGGCGVPSVWLAAGGGAVVLAAVLLLRRPPANVKQAKVAKTGSSRPVRRKAVVRGKPKRVKQAR